MKGYCLVVRAREVSAHLAPPHATRVKVENAIHSVSLVDADENKPITTIKGYCRHHGLLPWPVVEWDEHEEEVEWFTVRDVERLKSIVWREVENELEAQIQKVDKIEVYRAFEIRQVSFTKALDMLNNEVINRARGLGWRPRRLVNALDLLAWAMEEGDQAEAYREEVLDMVEDTVEAVEATESIYQYDAEEFLEEEAEPPRLKTPKNMTDEELIEEATRLHGIVFMTDNFGTEDLRRHNAMEVELSCRHYDIHTSGGSYSITEQEEE